MSKRNTAPLTVKQFRVTYPQLYQELRKDILDELLAEYTRNDTPTATSRVIVAPTTLPAVKKVELPKPIGNGKSRSHAKKIDARTFEPVDGRPLWQIDLSPLVAKQLWGYWQGSGNLEISGLGVISWDQEPTPGEPFHAVIESVEFLSSGDTGSNSFIGAAEQGQYWMRLDDAGVDITKARLWWHSHAHMGCFWSATDDGNIQGTMEEQAMDRKRPNGWSLSTVMSFDHAEPIRARVDYWDREHGDWTVDFITVVQPAEVLADPIRMAIEEVDDQRYQPFTYQSNLPTIGYGATYPALPPRHDEVVRYMDGADVFDFTNEPEYYSIAAGDLQQDMKEAVIDELFEHKLLWAERFKPEAMHVISNYLTDQEEQVFWSLFGDAE